MNKNFRSRQSTSVLAITCHWKIPPGNMTWYKNVVDQFKAAVVGRYDHFDFVTVEGVYELPMESILYQMAENGGIME